MGKIAFKPSLFSTVGESKLGRVWLYLIAILVLAFFFGFFYFLWNITYLADQYAKEIALRDAVRFHSAVNEFRNYYSRAVVANLAEADVDITHDYHLKDKAIPLPATLTRELGQNISSNSNASSMAFYSDYPFPWHEETLMDNDQFMQDALDYLRKNPDEVYFKYVTDSVTGEPLLRYATPSIMNQSCVDCHNNHPDSPRKDWQVGDVRGVLEVSVPISYVNDSEDSMSTRQVQLSSILLLLSAVGLSVAGYSIRSFSLNEIADRNKKLEAEILEREKAEEKMRVAMKAARDANEAKSRFLATMSHELRTPLNAIIGYSELLEEDFNNAKDLDTAEDLGRIKQSGRHLLTVINDILDLSKIEAGKIDLHLNTVEISLFLGQINDFAHLFIDPERIEFITTIDPNIKSIYTDHVRLRQILLNLLNNAVKFTERGTIEFEIKKEFEDGKEYVVFRIADTGIGMPEELIPQIFNPFVQGESGTDRKYEGTGLGLSITNSLCQLLGGRLEVNSREGQGSSFMFYLPNEKAEREIEPLKQVDW
ncbi:MAG: ATP-binding protein [Chloroflexota bacterium]